jgi:hypothetical protein
VRKVLLGAALAFLVLSLVGGYGLHWKWTGFSENGSVWDWLNLCLLPIALAFVPLAFEFSTRALLAIGGTFAVVMAVLIIGGYGFGWTWTGFPGNTLWDWLHLLLVPVALPFVAHELGERQKRQHEAAAAEPSSAAATEPDGRPAPEETSNLAARS